MSQTPAQKSPITDSPWLWVALYGVAAIVGLVLAQNQVTERQVRIERQTQGRARAAEMVTTGEATTEMSTVEDTVIEVEPLLMLLAGGVLLASCIFWIWRFTRGRSRGPDSVESEALQTRDSLS